MRKKINKSSKEHTPASVPAVLHVRVAEPIKKAYEDIAKARTKPNHKTVTVADVTREALEFYLERKEQAA